MDNGFPRGLAESSCWRLTIQLLDEQLTLMSDGMIESRDRASELFGFERITNIAAMKNTFARSAHDDIRKVTLTRQKRVSSNPPSATLGQQPM